MLFAGSKVILLLMKTLVSNKRMAHNYSINDKYTAGIVLSGNETKALKTQGGSLDGSYVTIKNDEAWLEKSYIPPYKNAGLANTKPSRSRKLLMHKNEIKKLIAARQNSTQIVPLALVQMGNLIKLNLGIGTPKKKHDKRQELKKRDDIRSTRYLGKA